MYPVSAKHRNPMTAKMTCHVLVEIEKAKSNSIATTALRPESQAKPVWNACGSWLGWVGLVGWVGWVGD